MRKKKIKIPLYYGELILIQDKNLKRVDKKYNFKSIALYGAISFRNHTKKGYTRYAIAFGKNPNSPNMIAHESLHTVSAIFEDRGIKFQLDNDEPQAYLLGWVVKECYKFLKVKKS